MKKQDSHADLRQKGSERWRICIHFSQRITNGKREEEGRRQPFGGGGDATVRRRRRVSLSLFFFALGYMCKCNKEFGMIENSLDLTERRGRSLLGWKEENGDIYCENRWGRI